MLNAPATPMSSLLLANFNALSVSKVVITNVSKQTVIVNSSLLTDSTSASRGSKFSLKAGETVQVNLLNEQAGQIFSTEKNVLLVTAAFTTAPAGIALLSNLNSR